MCPASVSKSSGIGLGCGVRSGIPRCRQGQAVNALEVIGIHWLALAQYGNLALAGHADRHIAHLTHAVLPDFRPYGACGF